MIYINYVELHSSMFYAKFQIHRPRCLLFTALHGGHLGHMTWIIYINFLCPFLSILRILDVWKLHMKFGFDWLRGDVGKVSVSIHRTGVKFAKREKNAVDRAL